MPDTRDEQILALAEIVGRATDEWWVETHEHVGHTFVDPACPTCVAQVILAAGWRRIGVGEAVERAAKARYQRTTRFSHDEDRPWDTDYPAEVIKERFRDMVRETVQDALGEPNA